MIAALRGPELEEARALIRAHITQHSTAHDAGSAEALVAALPSPYDVRGGGLWIARAAGATAGCVALSPLGGAVAEVKRMYVRDEQRGRGVARAMLAHVIAEARALGHTTLRLGTLRSMVAAQHLYTSAGFQPIPPYRAVEFGDTLFYELVLTALPHHG